MRNSLLQIIKHQLLCVTIHIVHVIELVYAGNFSCSLQVTELNKATYKS